MRTPPALYAARSRFKRRKGAYGGECLRFYVTHSTMQNAKICIFAPARAGKYAMFASIIDFLRAAWYSRSGENNDLKKFCKTPTKLAFRVLYL